MLSMDNVVKKEIAGSRGSRERQWKGSIVNSQCLTSLLTIVLYEPETKNKKPQTGSNDPIVFIIKRPLTGDLFDEVFKMILEAKTVA